MSAETALEDHEQGNRARQYAICTHALMLDHVTDGAEGVFDQALTNGLAAIVAYSWPGQEKNGRGRVLSADELLGLIEDYGKAAEEGVVRVLHDPTGPDFSENPFDDQPWPNFTEVAVGVLRDGIKATQAIRHARALDHETTRVISDQHLAALDVLDQHPALGALLDEMRNRHEQRTYDADAAEMRRAAAYLEAIGEEEQERRAALDYVDLYARSDRKGLLLVDVEECPVCLHISFVATSWDGRLGELGIGHCLICSYQRTSDAAESDAIDVQIQRAVEGDN